MILYNLKSEISHANVISYRITKFDEDLNPESSYIVHNEVCECPAGIRDTCRHRKMLPIMLPRVDSVWFYCFDDGKWYDPTGDAIAPANEFVDPASADEASSASEPEIRRLR